MASPNALNNDSLIWLILSNEFRDVMEKTMTYPSTPTDAFRDSREYSSYTYKKCMDLWFSIVRNNVCEIALVSVSPRFLWEILVFNNEVFEWRWWHAKYQPFQGVKDCLSLFITYHSSSINYICSKMNLSKSYGFVMGVFNCRVITANMNTRFQSETEKRKKRTTMS